MFRYFTSIIASGLLILTSPSFAAGTVNKVEIEEIIRSYLLDHPELLQEMSDRLQAKERAATEAAQAGGLKANSKLVFAHAGDASIGNPKGKVTIVEFLDYNCGWCKKSVAEVAAMTEADKDLRVVFKEFPIFGQGSEYAARAALAAAKQGKYWNLHQALFAHETKITTEVVDAVAKSVDIDVAKMKADMMAPEILETISMNYELAKALQIDGTPAFVIDDKVMPGYSPAAKLAEYVAAVKANGCKYC